MKATRMILLHMLGNIFTKSKLFIQNMALNE